MPESKVISLGKRVEDEEKPFFEQLLQEGARKLLQAAIENEVIDYIQFHKDRRDENGQPLVVRNGHLPEREIVSGIGPIKRRRTNPTSRLTNHFNKDAPVSNTQFFRFRCGLWPVIRSNSSLMHHNVTSSLHRSWIPT